jgi:hypothetical protein
MGLASPLWLWGLASLAIPIGIHFWSRRAARVQVLPSIRFLPTAPAPARRWWQLTDIARLLLRCLLLMLVVLALCEPFWRGSEGQPAVVLVVPGGLGVVQDRSMSTRIDSLRRADVEWRSLSPGFPMLPTAVEEGLAEDTLSLPTDMYALVAQAEARFQGQIHVLAPNALGIRRGARPALGARVVWHSLAGMIGSSRVLAAIANADSIWLWQETAQGDRTATSVWAGKRSELSRETNGRLRVEGETVVGPGRARGALQTRRGVTLVAWAAPAQMDEARKLGLALRVAGESIGMIPQVKIVDESPQLAPAFGYDLRPGAQPIGSWHHPPARTEGGASLVEVVRVDLERELGSSIPLGELGYGLDAVPAAPRLAEQSGSSERLGDTRNSLAWLFWAFGLLAFGIDRLAAQRERIS